MNAFVVAIAAFEINVKFTLKQTFFVPLINTLFGIFAAKTSTLCLAPDKID